MKINEAVMRMKQLIKAGYPMSEAAIKVSNESRFSIEKLEKYYIDNENNE